LLLMLPLSLLPRGRGSVGVAGSGGDSIMARDRRGGECVCVS
jgi:hypothetical protein